MVDLKIGDYVVVSHPTAFENIVTNKVGRIIRISPNPEVYEASGLHPYTIRFLNLPEEYQDNGYQIYSSKEVKKINPKDLLAYLI